MNSYTIYTTYTVLLCIVLSGTVNSECPVGWHHYADSCYMFSKDSFTWLNAQSSCKAHNGGRLAEVYNKEQAEYLVYMAGILKNVSDYWLGGRDDVIEGTWQWSSTDNVFTYGFWYPGKPSNSYGGEDCLEMRAHYQWKWNDSNCSTVQPFICQKPYSIYFHLNTPSCSINL